MNLKRSSASRGELTKAMSATLREVRLHHQQIAAALAGIQQLMDGQVALGEAVESYKQMCKGLFDDLEFLKTELSAFACPDCGHRVTNRDELRMIDPARPRARFYQCHTCAMSWDLDTITKELVRYSVMDSVRG